MSATTVRLLQAAAEITGGNKALAERLGVSETLLWKFMGDSLELPDPLLLRAVDIILESRQPSVRSSPTESGVGSLQNCGREIHPARGTDS